MKELASCKCEEKFIMTPLGKDDTVHATKFPRGTTPFFPTLSKENQ
jgi:hypothetical protein